MNVLIIGGTRFIGAGVVRRLIQEGHEVTVFHRGQTNAELPASVKHILGDRGNLSGFASELSCVAPDVVVDMVCFDDRQAETLMRIFRSIARRVVVAGSMDVYRAYGGRPRSAARTGE